MSERFHARIVDLGDRCGGCWVVLAKDDEHAEQSVEIEDGEGFVRAAALDSLRDWCEEQADSFEMRCGPTTPAAIGAAQYVYRSVARRLKQERSG